MMLPPRPYNCIILALAATILALLPRSTLSFATPKSSSSTKRGAHQERLLFSQQNSSTDEIGNPVEINRRSFNAVSAATALSALLLTSANLPFPVPPAMAADYDDSKKQRILITGSNSGIGLDAAQRLARRGHEVVLACVSIV